MSTIDWLGTKRPWSGPWNVDATRFEAHDDGFTLDFSGAPLSKYRHDYRLIAKQFGDSSVAPVVLAFEIEGYEGHTVAWGRWRAGSLVHCPVCETDGDWKFVRALVTEAYLAWRGCAPGLFGLARRAGKTADDFDPDDLAEGQEVEMEHTGDAVLARLIAMDHLTEDPDYYEKLRLIE